MNCEIHDYNMPDGKCTCPVKRSKKRQTNAMLKARVKRLEEAANNLKEFCETNPANVLDIPDEVWVPFCNALNETDSK